jgi:hypothetical protein
MAGLTGSLSKAPEICLKMRTLGDNIQSNKESSMGARDTLLLVQQGIRSTDQRPHRATGDSHIVEVAPSAGTESRSIPKITDGVAVM